MSVVKHGARTGAAAILLGLALIASPPDAFADTPGTGDSRPDVTDNARHEKSPRKGATRPGAAKPAATPAAASTADTVRKATEVSFEVTARQPRRDSQNMRLADPCSRTRFGPQSESANPATQIPTTQIPTTQFPTTQKPATQKPASQKPSVVESGNTAVPANAIAGVSVNPAPTRPAPVALAAMTAPAGITAAPGTAAVTMNDLFSGFPAPIREVLEGASLLLRRTFFNQTPIVSPVQLSGHSEGTVTGTVGAVDPEGDPLTYSITAGPRYGSAVVNPDGSYSYTPGPGFAGTDSFIAAATDTGFHINLLDVFRSASTSANVAVSQGAPADVVQFTFIYGAGSQFWSSAARSSLAYAATTLSSILSVNSPVTLTYAVTGQFSPFSATLASAGSDLIGAGPGFLRTVVQNKILTGGDANESASDATISWNFGPGWAFGDSVAGNQYDFQSIAVHELVHSLGFLTYVDQAGSNNGRSWTTFDGYLATSDGTAVINSDYVWDNAYDPNLTGGNGGLFFGGPNAVAAYGGLVPLFTPGLWQSGSSLSHLKDSTFAGADRKLMTARIRPGLGYRIISPLERAILQDLGYTVTPGPGASVLAFAGLFLVRRLRRRN